MPDGELVSSKARGLFTGNRGVIHDPETRTLAGRRWTTSAWICCSLEWKDRRRDVWGRNYRRRDGSLGAGWSELFFLDEITALAAGHRPCHTCRNADAKAFHTAFCAANGTLDASGKNRLLHSERWHSSRGAAVRLSGNDLPALPDGTMIFRDGAFFALKNEAALPWSLEGYGDAVPFSALGDGELLQVTPASIIGALREGYQPAWHPTAV